MIKQLYEIELHKIETDKKIRIGIIVTILLYFAANLFLFF